MKTVNLSPSLERAIDKQIEALLRAARRHECAGLRAYHITYANRAYTVHHQGQVWASGPKREVLPQLRGLYSWKVDFSLLCGQEIIDLLDDTIQFCNGPSEGWQYDDCQDVIEAGMRRGYCIWTRKQGEAWIAPQWTMIGADAYRQYYQGKPAYCTH